MLADEKAPEATQGRILIVDDSDLERLLIRQRLRADRFAIVESADGLSALEAARACAPDLILLDLGLPDMSGYEVLHRLKEDAATRTIPVIFLSGMGSSGEKVHALDLGAIDFITKPFDAAELRARVRVALRLKSYQDMLEQKAHLDALTGLANRHALEIRLDADWSACRRRGVPISLVIVDLDHFKRINDRFGHNAGDEALRLAATALRAVARGSELLARYGGEEFVLIAPDCDLEGALGLGERAREQVASLAFAVGDEPVAMTASVGVATAAPGRADGVDSASTLLRFADLALYRAKAGGRDAVWFRAPDGLYPHPPGPLPFPTG